MSRSGKLPRGRHRLFTRPWLPRGDCVFLRLCPPQERRRSLPPSFLAPSRGRRLPSSSVAFLPRRGGDLPSKLLRRSDVAAPGAGVAETRFGGVSLSAIFTVWLCPQVPMAEEAQVPLNPLLEEPVGLEDVAVYFAQEEWGLLSGPQDVMLENFALSSSLSKSHTLPAR
ncbi:zinc finger protein 584 [Ochotona princeps]|uniref:zinc finger protein 584 n=1 Tax=Ochotona princeps TaxID=9978 RepID=UPI002714F4FC|nr:zinc finger protein 584 [Ochotona princeps]